MKTAYIILAYKNPAQVYRMIERLQNINTYFYLHIDTNTNINDFENIPAGISIDRLNFSKKGSNLIGLVSVVSTPHYIT